MIKAESGCHFALKDWPNIACSEYVCTLRPGLLKYLETSLAIVARKEP